MTNIETGGPAFPVPNDANVDVQEGMTLRDFLAAAALTGIVSCPDTLGKIHVAIADDTKEFGRFLALKQVVAINAYSYADAMIQARKENQ